MAKPKIYIVNKGCHDFSAAEKFGTLITLTEGKYNLLAIGKMYRDMEDILSKSSHDDYIILCGPTVMNVIATSIFTKLHGKLNLLIYCVDNNRDGFYTKRVINIK